MIWICTVDVCYIQYPLHFVYALHQERQNVLYLCKISELHFKKEILSIPFKMSITQSTWLQESFLGLSFKYLQLDSCCSVIRLCLKFCNPMDYSTPGFFVLHDLPEFTQTHVHWVSDAIQPPQPLLPTSPPALNFSQHQGLFQLVSSLHQVAKVLELQLQQ